MDKKCLVKAAWKQKSEVGGQGWFHLEWSNDQAQKIAIQHQMQHHIYHKHHKSFTSCIPWNCDPVISTDSDEPVRVTKQWWICGGTSTLMRPAVQPVECLAFSDNLRTNSHDFMGSDQWSDTSKKWCFRSAGNILRYTYSIRIVYIQGLKMMSSICASWPLLLWCQTGTQRFWVPLFESHLYSIFHVSFHKIHCLYKII